MKHNRPKKNYRNGRAKKGPTMVLDKAKVLRMLKENETLKGQNDNFLRILQVLAKREGGRLEILDHELRAVVEGELKVTTDLSKPSVVLQHVPKAAPLKIVEAPKGQGVNEEAAHKRTGDTGEDRPDSKD